MYAVEYYATVNFVTRGNASLFHLIYTQLAS